MSIEICIESAPNTPPTSTPTKSRKIALTDFSAEEVEWKAPFLGRGGGVWKTWVPMLILLLAM